MNDKHNVCKIFRFTEREAKTLAAYAAKAELTQSEYIRALMRNPSRVFVSDGEQLTRIYRELKHQGVNLNQIAYAINAGYAKTLDGDCLTALNALNAASLRELANVLDEMKEARHAHR